MNTGDVSSYSVVYTLPVLESSFLIIAFTMDPWEDIHGGGDDYIIDVEVIHDGSIRRRAGD